MFIQNYSFYVKNWKQHVNNSLKKKKFHDEESVAPNTQQGICHKDKNWNPAWENWPRTHGGSFGTIVGKNILNTSDGKMLVYELCVTMG